MTLPAARSSADSRTRLGAVLWLAGPVIWFAAQIVAGSAWSRPSYSWAGNNVSDLGHVHCQMWSEDGYGPIPVCSPLHPWMNAAFVVAGACLVGGTVLLTSLWRRSRSGGLARVGVGLVGTGLIISGLVPADLAKQVHQGLGALPIAVFGVFGLLLSARSLSPAFRGLALLAGVLGIVALGGFALFLTGHDVGLGPGGMERVWGYACVVWTFCAGASLVRRRPGRSPTGAGVTPAAASHSL